MTATTTTLAEALPLEIQRCQNLLEDYAEIGPAGTFAVAMIKADIATAQKAILEGDTVAMIRIYHALERTN